MTDRAPLTDDDWGGYSYAGDDAAVQVVIDQLAPNMAGLQRRVPIFEWGHETTPTPSEVEDLAREIVAAVRSVEAAP